MTISLKPFSPSVGGKFRAKPLHRGTLSGQNQLKKHTIFELSKRRGETVGIEDTPPLTAPFACTGAEDVGSLHRGDFHCFVKFIKIYSGNLATPCRSSSVGSIGGQIVEWELFCHTTPMHIQRTLNAIIILFCCFRSAQWCPETPFSGRVRL